MTQLAEALVELGVGAGDRVAIFMPMCPEVAVASHACAHIGAVQVPIFSGLRRAGGRASGSRTRGRRSSICADWSLRRGTRVPMRETLDEALRESPSVEHVVEWSRVATGARNVELGPGELAPLEVDSEHPYLLAYTSGTTGRPKGALHVHGGFLVSIAREVAYQSDVRAGDRVLFATDMGWIMGPWTVVGAGAIGAAVIYIEGAPDWPDDRLWRTVEEERVTMLGVSPTLIRALIPKGDPEADLSSLQVDRDDRRAVERRAVRLAERARRGGGRVPIVNLSGGTEVGACFLSVALTEPIEAGLARLPGARPGRWTSFDAEGTPLRGEVGELVCTRPWPGMTRGVWGDRERYLDTYWRRFPGVWTHGDWASIDEDGYWFLHGRSDDTLNIAGKRIGPAELESAAIDHPVGRGGRGDRRPARGEGRDGLDLLRAAKPGAEQDADEVTAAVGRRARQGVQARAGRLRVGAAEDAVGQDRPARGAREGARRGSRRPLDAREPRVAGGDRQRAV